MSVTTQGLTLADEAATERLAQEIAAGAGAGDTILLSGDLGSGKTTLARALIRAVAGDPGLEVPSPTFTLVQTYETARVAVTHLDLYRIGDAYELDELGVDDLRSDGMTIVEWPERAKDAFPGDRLEISLSLDPANWEARLARLAGHGVWAGRLERMAAIRSFLAKAGFAGHRRRFLQGDASTRRYERLVGEIDSAILMDAPRRPDPGTSEVPYSRIAHLAEDVVPFVAVARTLKAAGLSAPEIFAADLAAGLLVLEDLGTLGVIDESRRPIPERYAVAVELAAHLHGLALPEAVEAAPGVVHRLPRYDMEAFLAEVSLVLDWFAPHATGKRLSAEVESDFRAIWTELLAPLVDAGARRTWVLRDCHSPNMLWLPEREGIARIGLLDFQDAVTGPAAYDVASIVADARVDVPPELAGGLASRYAAARAAVEPGFDEAAFARDTALMIAQRNSKILGIFARLAKRDDKPGYLAHLPRISGYLERALAHEVLSPLKLWYDTHLPAHIRIRDEDDGT